MEHNKKFERLLKRVGRMTQANYHTTARIAIARFYGFKDLEKELMKIEHEGIAGKARWAKKKNKRRKR
jgi:hypothetical protein